MKIVTWLKLMFSDKYFFRLHHMYAIETPTKRNQNSVYNFIDNTQSQVSSESEWVRQRADLAVLGHGVEHGWFNGVIEDVLGKYLPKLSKVSSATTTINDLKTVISFGL